jgi:hypothetical protein
MRARVMMILISRCTFGTNSHEISLIIRYDPHQESLRWLAAERRCGAHARYIVIKWEVDKMPKARHAMATSFHIWLSRSAYQFIMRTSAKRCLQKDLSIISHDQGDVMMTTLWARSNWHLLIKHCKQSQVPDVFIVIAQLEFSVRARGFHQSRVSIWIRSRRGEIHNTKGSTLESNYEFSALCHVIIFAKCSLEPRRVESFLHQLESAQIFGM